MAAFLPLENDRSYANLYRMSPRRSAAEAAGTRTAIVERALVVGSMDGLEGLTIGRLAGDVGMSKSGLIRHFGSKQGLQMAALDAAVRLFRREIWDRAKDAQPGLLRLRAICDAWFSYLERDLLPGGCFLTAAASEFDGRGGPVGDATSEAWSRWLRVLEAEARTAIEDGDLPAESDPAQIAFELNAIAMALNHARQLFGDRTAGRHARRAVERVLGPE
jgi:AcrR family transcriptional regulator